MAKDKDGIYLTSEELDEVQDPRVAMALMLKEQRKQTKLLEQMDWKLWETMKTVVGDKDKPRHKD